MRLVQSKGISHATRVTKVCSVISRCLGIGVIDASAVSVNKRYHFFRPFPLSLLSHDQIVQATKRDTLIACYRGSNLASVVQASHYVPALDGQESIAIALPKSQGHATQALVLLAKLEAELREAKIDRESSVSGSHVLSPFICCSRFGIVPSSAEVSSNLQLYSYYPLV